MRTVVVVLMLGALLVAAWLTLQSLTAHREEGSASLAPVERAFDAREKSAEGARRQGELLDRAAEGN